MLMELYFGGPIYTLVEEGKTVEAVLVKNGVIHRVGTLAELQPLATTLVDLQGTTMIPGLVDSHIHLIGYGEKLTRVQLGEAKSKGEIIQSLKEAAQNLQAEEWLIAEGWNEFNLVEGEMLTLAELDAITNNPVILHRICHHVMLVNSRVLKLAGISPDTVAPEGGIIGKDTAGMVTGFLYEEAMQLAQALLQTEGDSYKRYLQTCIHRAINELHTYGVVGAHSEDCAYYGHFENVVQAYEQTIGKHKHFRAHLLRHHKVFEQMILAEPKEVPGFVEYGAMKIFADGSFGGSTAALLEPYLGEDKNYGLFVHNYDQFESLVQMARAHKEAIAVHVIGDAAVELVISMIEKYPTPTNKRDRIIHACLLSEQLIERMRQLPNIIVDIQPAFVPSDFPWVEQKLGRHRMRYAYAWKTLRDFHPAIGTDAPIEDVNPFKTIAAAVQRDAYGSSNEQLTVYEVIKMYTYGVAYAINKEDERGLIAPGYRADFTVLQQNIFEVSSQDIEKISVSMTIVDGNIVYKAKM